MLVTHEMKEMIHRMVEDVEQRVSKALSEEIRRLAVLVDEFSVPFHPESLVLNVYKRELHTHVENGLGTSSKDGKPLNKNKNRKLKIEVEN